VPPTARSHPSIRRGVAASTLALALAALTAACSATGVAPSAAGGSAGPSIGTVRLGYFPNVTHATALVGVEKGHFQEALGSVKLETATFNSGTTAAEALLSGAIDATYIGPNPAVNAFSKSKGEAIRIISGATSGGAALVVKPDITSAAQLKGKKLATPSIGNTQDVALRFWLKEQGLATDPAGGGDVAILPQENAQSLETFRSGDIDGAWVPEPWATRLIQEGGGKVLVDEATLWPGGRFVTTHLIVRTEFLRQHPDVVKLLLQGQVKANDAIAKDPAAAQEAANAGIEKITTKKLPEEVITASWNNLTFTDDPIPTSLQVGLDHAVAVGLTSAIDLKGIYDVTLLNEVLVAAGKPPITVP
jgi:NitT/TauT family transport system substrate-binding protein